MEVEIETNRKFERKALAVDKTKICEPIGAAYASLGIEGCLPVNHGSPGCCRYIRAELFNIFNKNVKIVSTNLKENAAIFGGKENFKAAIKNILINYEPKVIAVHTTCMSETIGENMLGLKNEVDIPKDKYLICGSTPSYSGSHITGYSNMLKAFIDQLTIKSYTKKDNAFIIVGLVYPSDMREIKNIINKINIKYTLFPDTSNVLDRAIPRKLKEFPKGGTKVLDIVNAESSKIIISLGTQGAKEAGKLLESKSNSIFESLEMPIGIKSTDEFINKLLCYYHKEVNKELIEERETLIDLINNSYKKIYHMKVAILLDPDTAIPLTEFLCSIGIISKYVMTSVSCSYFEMEITKIMEKYNINGLVKSDSDIYELKKCLIEEKVEAIIGESHLSFLSEELNIPLIKMGFPIENEYIHLYKPIVGYKGAMNIIEKILLVKSFNNSIKTYVNNAVKVNN